MLLVILKFLHTCYMCVNPRSKLSFGPSSFLSSLLSLLVLLASDLLNRLSGTFLVSGAALPVSLLPAALLDADPVLAAGIEVEVAHELLVALVLPHGDHDVHCIASVRRLVAALELARRRREWDPQRHPHTELHHTLPLGLRAL